MKPKRERTMYATEQFFTKPGGVEALVRDEGMRIRFVVPVVVMRAKDHAAMREEYEVLKQDFRAVMKQLVDKDRLRKLEGKG